MGVFERRRQEKERDRNIERQFLDRLVLTRELESRGFLTRVDNTWLLVDTRWKVAVRWGDNAQPIFEVELDEETFRSFLSVGELLSFIDNLPRQHYSGHLKMRRALAERGFQLVKDEEDGYQVWTTEHLVVMIGPYPEMGWVYMASSRTNAQDSKEGFNAEEVLEFLDGRLSRGGPPND